MLRNRRPLFLRPRNEFDLQQRSYFVLLNEMLTNFVNVLQYQRLSATHPIKLSALHLKFARFSAIKPSLLKPR